MPVVKKEKTAEARLHECNVILGKLVEQVKVPESNLSVVLLKKRMARWVQDGRLQEDRVPLVNSDRYIIYRLPKWANQQAEVTLRKSLIIHHQLPSDLMAEIEAGTSSVPQSDPAHPSPQE